MNLEILFQDEFIVAINKPHGLLVHKSSIAKDVSEFALQTVRNQLNQHVFPVHRLDRKTSGVLLFALNEEIARQLNNVFAERTIEKRYLAIVRGYTKEAEEIDYPLKKEKGKLQEAKTLYRRLQTAEVNMPLGKHSTSRYSLVEVTPETGRMHQIRKHFAHILHPIIGDRPYGCNKQNRMFKEKWQMDTMLLHASSLSFTHPVERKLIKITADIQPEFERVMEIMNFEKL